jgi:hypothetical protein
MVCAMYLLQVIVVFIAFMSLTEVVSEDVDQDEWEPTDLS